MKIRKLLSLFTLFFVSLVVAVSCTSSPEISTSSNSAIVPVRIAINNWPGCILLQVAQVKHLFGDHKIDVNLRWFESYLDAIKALAAGSVDGANQTLNDLLAAKVHNHSEESYNIMAERAGVSVEEYRKNEAGVKIFNIEDNLKAFSAGNDMTFLSYAAKEVNKFLVKNGLIKKEPDVSNTFDDRFVKAYAAAHSS